jgi:hypothetical protein
MVSLGGPVAKDHPKPVAVSEDMKLIVEGNNPRINLDHLHVGEQSPLLTVDDLGEFQIIRVGRCPLD